MYAGLASSGIIVSGFVQIVSKLEMGDTETEKNRYHEDLVSFLFYILGKKVVSNVSLVSPLGLYSVLVCSQAQHTGSSSKLHFTVRL
jgi:hypothetical protein